jgi:hypothetical protein
VSFDLSQFGAIRKKGLLDESESGMIGLPEARVHLSVSLRPVCHHPVERGALLLGRKWIEKLCG